MQTYSGTYVSNVNFTDPGYRSLASSSISYLAQEGLIKKSSQNANDKYRYDTLSYSRSKQNIFPEPNLSKRASVDFMKKSIQPYSIHTSNSSNEGFLQKSHEEYKRFDLILTDKTNSDSYSKPHYSRKSLNINSVSGLKLPTQSRKSYNFPSQETILSPQLKEFFLEKSKSKDKSPKKTDRENKKAMTKTYHKRHPSSYGFSHQTQPQSNSQTSTLKKNQQNCSGFFIKKRINLAQDKMPQKVSSTVEPLSFKNNSEVDISISSEGSISEEQTEMTARFNFNQENKKSSENRTQQKLTTSLGKKISQQTKNSQQPKKIITLSNFILGPCKGKGRYGKVYLAIQRETRFIYALKQINIQVVKTMLNQFISQLKIQSFLQSPYITKIYGYFIQNDHVYLIMEYMTDGNLYERIKKRGPIVQKRAAMKLFQISQGLKEMHHFNVIHRDLKPQNIVMTFDVCKICDFSWSVKCEQRRLTNCGTLDYLSPEMISGQGYSSSIDLWAMGVLLYQMLVGKPPFYNTSIKQTTKRIKQCSFTLPDSLSESAKQLIECFLRRDPQQRKQIGDIVKHSFFQSIQQ